MNMNNDTINTLTLNERGFSMFPTIDYAFLKASASNGFKFNTKLYKGFTPQCIKDVQFYPPAVKMTFTDGTVTTSVAQGDDEYNPEQGMIMCILQYIFGDKTYNNMFRKWIKKDEDRKIAEEKKVLAEKKAKEIKARQEAREVKRKAIRAAKRREEAINIQKEAYLRAMKEASASADNKEV